MIGKKMPLIYWDSCVYITHLYPDHPRQAKNISNLNEIRELMRLSEINELRIVTSTLTMIEVTSCIEDDRLEKQFQAVFNGQYHVRYDVDPRVVAKARELRFSLHKQDPKIKISTPDAIHIATAMILKAGEFHTFDDGKMDKERCSLLRLNGNPALKGLKICRPETEQLPLLTLSPPSGEQQMPLLDPET